MKNYTKAQFIEKCSKKYSGKYDYSKVVFITVRDAITIICPIHGEFTQIAKQHLYNSKTGCTKCGNAKCRVTRIKTTENFIKKATKTHNNYYSYHKTIYKQSNHKVTITCPIHGDFEQTPSSHLAGSGCKQCGYKIHSTKMLLQPNFWTYTAWQTRGEKSPNFVAYSLYIIECWNETERFIKIGKTFVDVKKRFNKTNEMPYQYKILHTLQSTAKFISVLETHLHTTLKMYAYKPLITFKGDSECFTANSIYNNNKEP